MIPSNTLFPIINIHRFLLALESSTNSANFQKSVCNFILKKSATATPQASKSAAPHRAAAKRGRSLDNDDKDTQPAAIHRGGSPSPKEPEAAASAAAGGSPESSLKPKGFGTFEKEAKPLSPLPPAIEPA